LHRPSDRRAIRDAIYTITAKIAKPDEHVSPVAVADSLLLLPARIG
jgi:hypothetical protein